jgi:hypothetical protein
VRATSRVGLVETIEIEACKTSLVEAGYQKIAEDKKYSAIAQGTERI